MGHPGLAGWPLRPVGRGSDRTTRAGRAVAVDKTEATRGAQGGPDESDAAVARARSSCSFRLPAAGDACA